MIFLRIVGSSELQIEQAAELLLTEKLVIDVNIKRHIERAQLVEGKLECTRVFLLTAKTRAVLFATIDKLMNKEFKGQIPEVYALPIVEMDWNQADQLRKEVKDKPSFTKLRDAVRKMRKLK